MTALQEKPKAVTPDGSPPRRRGKRATALAGTDKLVLALMLGIPAFVHLLFVWIPALGSVALSFSRWNGIGGFEDIEWIGVGNYVEIFTEYPRFWPAVQHNLIWLLFLLIVPTSVGLLLAVLLDRELRFSRIYQSALYMPMVLSLALVGFIWQLIYTPDGGLLNSVLGLDEPVDWIGDSDINLYAVMVAAAWRHTGYIMLLYLAGLKSVDPALKEAASLDGASASQTFFRVTFPVMKPVNIVVAVVTVIEALRAFDIVYVINKGRNGLELLSVLVTDNIIGEASRIGRGSAVAVILLTISLGVIIPYLYQVFSKENRT
ncbi:carbohydrate ABC transporter permease [Lentzea flaviverrucosa]|uniref:Multiple sugar transport system permease protein/raffinose/stachyose/melibiose transport system permease protein n=1 Tax=Lentzea flaviverrucosa TaxID=200379 RepID=A0A1H9M6C1_9PSEU|nr:sugar ABC transporter permease [Lentzea flaviverrucosa]RDI31063.1 carbohydrate ABC transporter membrane protein 1 (CUT1 family) [Lentzea flaviverrucosa]SER19019.1 multiple sugar transport system permease protein/raffinose/stachyose/melibiose transport system permease protein [Lentzea flaviverrucosa]